MCGLASFAEDEDEDDDGIFVGKGGDKTFEDDEEMLR